MNSELTPFQLFLRSLYIGEHHAFWECEKQFLDLWRFLHEAQDILIISHKRPDPDSLGANVALFHALTSFGKKVHQACVDEIPKSYKWITQEQNWNKEIAPELYDSIICVDCSSASQAAFWEKTNLATHPRVMVIDHHESQTFFGTHHCVFKSSPATCYVLTLFMLWAKWPLTPRIADALLFGFYYDTGSFKHSNTEASVLKLAGMLLKHSSSHKKIVHSIFRDFSLSKLKLWGLAFERASFIHKPFVSTALQKRDYELTATTEEDSSGIVSYLSHIQEAKAALFVSEYHKNRIKGSLRSIHQDFEVESYAKAWGGGGHKEAAGFEYEGKLHIQSTWHSPSLFEN